MKKSKCIYAENRPDNCPRCFPDITDSTKHKNKNFIKYYFTLPLIPGSGQSPMSLQACSALNSFTRKLYIAA
jgi:hypothetical protein